MKARYSHIGLAKLCGWFGLTRQAYYQNSWNAIETSLEHELVVQQVLHIRSRHPRMGTRKLYELLEPFMLEHQIKMGRDALFDLLSTHNLLVRRRRRYLKTTHSHHWLRKFPNLIRDVVPTRINQLWVSDITYWKLNNDRHVYISFITDAYSHKILGYHVAQTLEAVESLKALQQALSTIGWDDQPIDLIHHSDRGVQYCSQPYVSLLQDYGVQISMSDSGDPQQNAIAERVNGILKHEYLYTYEVCSLNQASKLLTQAIELYNTERPHMSISNRPPSDVHSSHSTIPVRKLWKNYYHQKRIIVNPLQD